MSSQRGQSKCLHCAGTGVEPFSDGEECDICLGEKMLPEDMNREYYDRVTKALDEKYGSSDDGE